MEKQNNYSRIVVDNPDGKGSDSRCRWFWKSVFTVLLPWKVCRPLFYSQYLVHRYELPAVYFIPTIVPMCQFMLISAPCSRVDNALWQVARSRVSIVKTSSVTYE